MTWQVHEEPLAENFRQLALRFRVIVWKDVRAETQEAMRDMFASLGMELRFCELDLCRQPFVPKRKDHDHCCTKHYDDDYNTNKRVTDRVTG